MTGSTSGLMVRSSFNCAANGDGACTTPFGKSTTTVRPSYGFSSRPLLKKTALPSLAIDCIDPQVEVEPAGPMKQRDWVVDAGAYTRALDSWIRYCHRFPVAFQ